MLVICYNGDTARIATSVLRAKGIEGDSLRGGYQALRDHGLWTEGGVEVPAPAEEKHEMPYPTAVPVASGPMN